MRGEELVRELPKGLIKWYTFRSGSPALFVKGGMDSCEVLAEAMEESGLAVDSISLEELMNQEEENCRYKYYEYIVLAGALERSREPEKMLQKLRCLLRPTGRLFMGTDNRLGIRYFCGDRDAFTERSFDSIENYTRISARDRENMKGRAYARSEIAHMLDAAGFSRYRFYSVLPGLALSLIHI